MTTAAGHGLTLYDFMTIFVLDGDPDGDDRAELSAEVARHEDHTMTILTRTGIETITRCKTCRKEPEVPCAALRRLALPYAHHPAFDPTWAALPSAVGGGRAVR